MNTGYFQRLAAQTWGIAPAGVSSAPKTAQAASDFTEVHEETVVATPASHEAPAHISAPIPGKISPEAAHTSQPASQPPSQRTKPEAKANPKNVSEPQIESKQPTPSIPPHLAAVWPDTPIMEEVIRWLAGPPTPIEAIIRAPVADQPPQPPQPQSSVFQEISETHESAAPIASSDVSAKKSTHFDATPSRRIAPAASFQATPEPEPDLGSQIKNQKSEIRNSKSPAGQESQAQQPAPPPPDYIVSIGSMSVTIEAPPQMAAPRVIERSRPAPAAPAARERRSTLARHYL